MTNAAMIDAAPDIVHADILEQHDKVLIIDFGSQVTQLIARRVREAGVYCEIAPFQSAEAAFAALTPKAVILSGGPASVTEAGSPRAPQAVFEAGMPVLGICYGEQLMAVQLGGEVESGHHSEYGRADVEATDSSPLLDGVWAHGRHPVWMSHGDRVTKLPAGFKSIGSSPNAPVCVIADEARRFYGLQFHPEVHHTPDGPALIANFLHKIAGCRRDWTMKAFRAEAVAAIRAKVGDGAGALRAVRRRRFRGGGGADPRGDRRPAHLRLRRPWFDARGRNRTDPLALPRALQYSAATR